MAWRKSKVDILKNEKYMDDAVSSAFLNLHKAAKRKTEYIWATKGFSPFDCIYNDPTKSETCKILDNTENKNTKHDSKSYCEISQKQSLPNSAKKKDGKKTVYFVSESKYSDLLSGKLVSNAKISELTGSNETLKANKLFESSVKQDIHKRNLDVGSGISEVKQSFPDVKPIKTQNGDKSVFKTEQISCDFGNSVSAYDANLNKNVKSSNNETEIKSNHQKSKMSNMEVQRNKFNEKNRWKIHLSSSANSLFPEQKHIENQKYTIENQNFVKKRDLLKTMLVLKIFKCDKVFDFILELKDFERMIKRFPKLKDVLPEIDKRENEVEFSADAVKVVFGFLCSLRYDAPDERTSVEVVAALKSWEIEKFRIVFLDEFIANLNQKSNINLAYRAALDYGLGELCNVFKSFFSDSDLSCDNRRYRKRKCYISVSTYVEPLEFHIPLKTVLHSTLKDNFDREITNEIAFKAIGGSYVITGFYVVLNLDNKRDTDLAYLDITSDVIRKKQNYHEEIKIRKPLRSNIAINFKKNLEVDQDETVEITVETRIKPYLCLAIQDNDVTEMDKEGQFCMNLKSNFKVPNSKSRRFFIGKLLYHPKSSHF